jgi:AmmeMemoRadiSam system protein B/AmmeMemoRadiSam system protein A
MDIMTIGARTPAVAGAFYPREPGELARTVDGMLAEAGRALPQDARIPKAIIAPHAGYIYSGPIAASVYVRLAPLAGKVRRVVLLGPAHRVAIHGLARSGATQFQTPLGAVPVDVAAESTIADLPQVTVSSQAHAQEHSLEVHLPFLQRVLGSFSVVPLVVGRAAPEEVAQVIERLWGSEETLIVVSSDLSHYLPYQQAQSVDRDTARAILNRRPGLDHQQACGATPVNGLLLAAGRRGLAPELHDLRTSGDTAGDRTRVVGYASFGLYPQSSGDTADDLSGAGQERALGEALLPIARSSIGGVLGLDFATRHDHPALHRFGACFVTLTRNRQLRGCIGSLQAHRTLLEDVKANAKAAAFMDPRFQPLSVTEFRQVRVEVSLLSPSEPMRFAHEEEAVAGLRPGVDGVILEWTRHRGTFLPQVWDQLPDARSFLRQLKRKAGLAESFWAEDLRLHRYTVTKWVENDLPDNI